MTARNRKIEQEIKEAMARSGVPPTPPPVDTSVVGLRKGKNFVVFETSRGSPTTEMRNSAGEVTRISTNDARRRIASLVRTGWRTYSY
jgi:hypothetical protein